MIKTKTTVNRSRAARPTDVQIRSCGSITQFLLKTPAAKKWVLDNVNIEPWMWMGNALNVDSHYADRLVDGMLDAGLEVF